MIIYNVTTLVSWPIHDEWLGWMQSEYLPELLATGFVVRYQLVRLIEVNEAEGPTYALQLYFDSAETFEVYRKKYLRVFQQRERDVWGDDATSFASLMKIIN